MSAARLAAETAFAVSRQPSTEAPPTIIVRRSRVPGAETSPAAATPDAVQAEASANANKGPRIFRLGRSGPPTADSTAAQSGPESVEPATASASQFTEAEEISVVRRKRRVSADQRPGPVVQIFKAPDADRSDDPIEARRAAVPVHGQDLSRAQVARLAEMLAGVQSVLDDIQRARVFRLLD